MGDSFEESGIFDASLSMWKGLKQNTDGTFSYEDEDFDPIPLDIYTAASLGEEEIVQDILDRKEIRTNKANAGGWTALMYASYMGHNYTVQSLLEAGADPDMRNPHGYTSLILSSMCGNEGTMHVLIQRGADIEAVDKRGWSALFHAASAGHQQTTEFLLKCGANCETVEPSQGLTPLMEASASGHELIVQQLLQFGADVSRRDYQGDTASSLALTYGHMKIVSLVDQYKSRRPAAKITGYNANHKGGGSNEKQTTSNKCGQSGPSIHAGPKAFAQMTGLGPNGKPQPHPNTPLFLQEQEPHVADVDSKPAKWDGPKDLETLLAEIGCSKHLSLFKEQDIDLHIFLTLSEADLKEIGITLFGPRRKMESAISRLTSDVRTGIAGKTEHVYADALNAKLQLIQAKLKEMKESKDILEAQMAQERELRKVTEGFLMEHKDMWASLRRLSDKWASAQVRLGQAFEQIRSHTQQSEKLHSAARSTRRDKQDATKSMQDIDTILLHTRDYMVKMQDVLQRVVSPPGISNKSNTG